MFSLRRVLGSALLRGSVPRRRVSGCFLCVVSSGVLCCVVLCYDAEFRDAFFASCPRECSVAWFCVATQSFEQLSLRRVLGGLLEMGRVTDIVPGGV